MTFIKGKPKTGGRKPGVQNVATRRRQQALAKLMAGKSGSDPLVFFTQVLADPSVPYDIRMLAARELAPYRHPKLSSIEARTGGLSHEDRLKQLEDMAAEANEEEGDAQKEGEGVGYANGAGRKRLES